MELNSIYEPVSEELQLVADELKKQLNMISSSYSAGNQDFMSQITRYLFNNPGKLLRPALVLLSGKAVDNSRINNDDQLIKLAAAVEFVHSASLIHDDIIDESYYRRHQTTLNKQHGNQIAILVGNIYYLQFISILIDMEIANTEHRKKLMRLFCETTKKLCFGEIYEHKIIKYGENPTLDEYLKVIENKTASLFSISCLGGGLICGADERILKSLENYGLFLGLAFQIIDDHIDRDSFFNTEINMIEKAKGYAGRAKEELAIIPENPAKKGLLALPDYVISRALVKNVNQK